ncbi:MAG: ABC transporter permease [Halofilum sp. (in: g-proteobacteria)]|nr:ABC transporter permease [Halofilum sp. (in: g-proteobacteria)]
MQSAGGGPGVTAFLVPRLFGAATTVHLVAVPLLTMHLVAGERRNATLALLLSAPVATADVVLGKFLGVMSVLAAMVALTALMPAALAAVTDVDGGALTLAALGALLFVTAAAAAGTCLSALSRSPVIAAVATLGLLLLLLLLGEWGRNLGGTWAQVLAYPAPSTHLKPFFTGLFDTGAVAFFALFAALFLVLAVRRLDNERLQR